MAIRPLPADTARLLGAASQLATPVSLVKELVENALDAGATAVEVRVSPNTVDKIEVRDDGHGILPADFAALGRRGHTSKLARFEDLPQVVGSGSLGFRGEGLASANSLGYVTITTRSSGAATAPATVASTFRLVRGIGGVVAGSLKPASAPVGTTVIVTCLFASLPVRRKAAEREAGKTLAAIKALLCGYALARPQRLRLVLRVFQRPAPVWQFLPRVVAGGAIDGSSGDSDGIMREAVCVLFGPEAARQCQEVVLCIAGRPAAMGFQAASTLAVAPMPETRFVFEGFLPKPGADLTKLAFGGYVSVDGRPLSAQRHGSTATKLLNIFWTHLGKTVALPPGGNAPQQQRKIRDAFIRLNIQCPVGSYDANVESSKADVLFADEQAVCDAFEQYCNQVYGDATQESERTQLPVQDRLQPIPSGCATDVDSSPQSSTSIPVRRTGRYQTMASMLQASGEASATQDTPCEHPLTTIRQERQAALFSPSSSPSGSVFLPPSPVVRPGHGGGVSYSGRSVIRRQQHDSMRSYRRGAPARGLQTPPPSSPVDGASQGRGDSRAGRGLFPAPGAVSQRAYRQTSLSFRAGVEALRPPRVAMSTGVSRPTVPTQQQAQRDDERHGAPGSLDSAPAVAVQRSPCTTGARHTADRDAVAREERPSCVVMEVSLVKLARAAGQLAARETAWGSNTDGLSEAKDDLAGLEKRVKDTIAKWLARQPKAGRGTVKVAFYLRQSLERHLQGEM